MATKKASIRSAKITQGKRPPNVITKSTPTTSVPMKRMEKGQQRSDEEWTKSSAAILEDVNNLSAKSDVPQCPICNQFCQGTNVVETHGPNGELFLCHSTCFNCLECGTSLANKKCYQDPSDPIHCRYCMQCYSNGTQSMRQCNACHSTLRSDFISIPKRGNFHPDCLYCGLCKKNLVDRPMTFDKTKDIFKCSPPCDMAA